MFINRVIPALLLDNNFLVKTVKFDKPKYVGDPINAVKIFNDKEVDELIIIDITATIEKRKPNFTILSEIASECFMPLSYGGGINSLDDIKKIFYLGVEKVIINSAAVKNPELVRQAVEIYGSQSIVISIDVKKNIRGKYQVYIYGGKKNTKLNPFEFSQMVEELGVGEIFLNSIDRDGTGQGYDIDLIKTISNNVSIPVIACGGAGKLEDFSKAIKNGGASAVAAGSMFVFHGKYRAVLISYPSINDMKKMLN